VQPRHSTSAGVRCLHSRRAARSRSGALLGKPLAHRKASIDDHLLRRLLCHARRATHRTGQRPHSRYRTDTCPVPPERIHLLDCLAWRPCGGNPSVRVTSRALLPLRVITHPGAWRLRGCRPPKKQEREHKKKNNQACRPAAFVMRGTGPLRAVWPACVGLINSRTSIEFVIEPPRPPSCPSSKCLAR